MNVVIIGAVQSTERALIKLVQHKLNVVGVFGYRAQSSAHVSGFTDLEVIADKAGCKFFPFESINDKAKEIEMLAPDVVFVIGLSQIVSQQILEIPTKYCIGFHPTKLPQGRGRAPLAWMILDRVSLGAATFFKLHRGVDDGPILVQKEFQILDSDDVQCLIDKTLLALDDALDELLPQLISGVEKMKPQPEELSSYYGKRAPEDGLIQWAASADDISRLVRATTSPYPCAFTYSGSKKISIERASASHEHSTRGVIGRILTVDCQDGFYVQCGESVLHVIQYLAEESWKPRVGALLGYYADSELWELRNRVARLEALLAEKID